MVQDIMNVYTDNIGLLIASAITFAFGFIEYIYSFRLVLKEKSAPFPIWMHTFYLAHDTTAAIVFFVLAKNNDWFWFFSLASVALVVWTLFEIFNLYMAVKVERQEIWGKFYNTPVTERQALLRIIGQVMLMIVVVNLFRVYMNDEVMLKWFSFTNIVMAIGPGFLWNERKSRHGSSVGLAIVILLGTINTFLPAGYGMFTTALPQTFDHIWFYLTGMIVSAFALRNLIMIAKFPAKKSLKDKKVIW